MLFVSFLLLLICYIIYCSGQLEFGHDTRQNKNFSCIPGYNQIYLQKNSVEVPVDASRCISDNHNVTPLKLKIGVIQYEPYIILHGVTGNAVTNVSGILIDVIDIIARKINFSYTFICVEDFGKEIAPHVWIGGVGHLVNSTIDVFATALSITPRRWQVIDYTVFISSDYMRLFFTNIYNENTLNWMVYWKPIHWEVYAITAAVALVAALCLKACYQLEFSRLGLEKLKPSFSWILFEGWTILVSQGVTVKPDLVCGKICVLVTSIMALLVLQSYSSQLVSHLTVTKQLKVRTVDDVLDKPNFKIGWFKLSIWEQEFKDSNKTQDRRIWSRVNQFKTGNIVGPADLDNFLKGESTCFLTSAYDFDFNSRICNYFPIGKISRDDLYIGLQKGSKLTAKFSKLILKLRESGVVKRIHHFYKARSTLHCHGKGDKTSAVPAVSLNVAIGIFTPLAVAIPFSLIVSLLENIHWNNCKRRKIK